MKKEIIKILTSFVLFLVALLMPIDNQIINENKDVILHQRVFDNFTTQRNYAISLANNEWVTFFDTDEENFRLDLRTYPKQLKEEALYKWYFNMQQRAPRR